MIKRLLIGLLFFTIACGGPSEINEEFEGKYQFTYPSGEVEILEIKSDHNFKQEIYKTKSSFKLGDTPMYYNVGIWNNKDVMLEFDHWLSYCKHDNPKNIRPKPEIITMTSVYYYEGNSEQKAFIDIYEENDYRYIRLEK